MLEEKAMTLWRARKTGQGRLAKASIVGLVLASQTYASSRAGSGCRVRLRTSLAAIVSNARTHAEGPGDEIAIVSRWLSPMYFKTIGRTSEQCRNVHKYCIFVTAM